MAASPGPGTTPDDVAPDGSPVAVYAALPDHDALDLVADQVPPGGSVLDLGCGVGRLANPLARRGHAVTAVDEHAGMLAHLDRAVSAVRADIRTLDLGRRFDVVVLASHLVNHHAHGLEFLVSCRRHVAARGAVLVERFHPDLLDDLDQREGVLDGVTVRHEIHDRDGGAFGASVHYTVAGTTWTQRYRAVLLDDAAFGRALRTAGLRHETWLDGELRWSLARAQTTRRMAVGVR